MFSVGELAKRFDVSRQTIYNKFGLPELKPYIIDNNGAKLTPEGLDVLMVLLSDSKVGQQVNKKLEHQRQHEFDNKDNYFDKYIKNLELQIDELKRDKISLQTKYDVMVDRMFSFEQKLLESSKPKERKSILQWLRIVK